MPCSLAILRIHLSDFTDIESSGGCLYRGVTWSGISTHGEPVPFKNSAVYYTGRCLTTCKPLSSIGFRSVEALCDQARHRKRNRIENQHHPDEGRAGRRNGI